MCLTDKVAKLFEKIIVARLNNHIKANKHERELDENQYGFRAGRSTINAITRVRREFKCIWEDNKVALAVALDINNAFNTLPWNQVEGSG